MGRFVAEKTVVRKVNGMEIVFWDEKSIYLRKDGARMWTIFHRWFAPEIDYRHHWKLFRKRLLNKKSLSYLECFEVAAEHGILATSSDRELTFDRKEIEVRDG